MLTFTRAVAVAICSALHNSVLQDDLSAVLDPEQIAGVKASGTFIARLPEQTRIELGGVFGRSYNKQFKVVLAFTLLNFLVAIVLAIARKKKGIFGKVPVRTLENEFTRPDRKHDGGKELAVTAGASEITRLFFGSRKRLGAMTNFRLRGWRRPRLTSSHPDKI